MRKFLAALAVGLGFCLLLAACDVNVTVNGLPQEEYYISTEFPDYAIVKTAAVGDIKAYLLEGAEDYKLLYFQDGEYVGGCSSFAVANVYDFCDENGRLVIISAVNLDLAHESYALTFVDKPEVGGDYLAMMTDDKNDWNKTTITRDVSQQKYILDIYWLPVYYDLDWQSTRWDDDSFL